MVIINTLIGIYPGGAGEECAGEIEYAAAPHAKVVRDGKLFRVDAEELVIDDIVVFRAGDQICADAIVEAGEVQVNDPFLPVNQMRLRSGKETI